MTEIITRRTALQWMGTVVAGLALSPTPYALIDDLTIATQTRGRSVALPTGMRGLSRTRCPACPRACALTAHTVGGRPYLLSPAVDGEAPTGCPLRPIVHHLALDERRLRGARLRDGDRFLRAGSEEGIETARGWVEAVRRHGGRIGVLDLSGRPALGLPAVELAVALDDALWIADPPHVLDPVGEALGLDSGRELTLDPEALEEVLWTGTPWFDEDGSARSGQLGKVLLPRPDGSGAVPSPHALDRLARRIRETGGTGDEGALLTRRRVIDARLLDRRVDLGCVEDASLDLLLVDASRPVGAVPWRYLRRKLRPGSGRLVVWTVGEGRAARHADLALATPAPLEIEEPVGGDRIGPATRLASSRPLLRRPPRTTTPADLARTGGVHESVPDGAEGLARALLRLASGRLVGTDGRARALDALPVEAIADRLRGGDVWCDDELVADGRARLDGERSDCQRRIVPDPHQRYGWLCFEGGRTTSPGEPLPPLFSKLVLEQHLLPREGTARIHPVDLERFGARSDRPLRVRTGRGEIVMAIREDASTPRGCVVAALGCGPESFGNEDPDVSTDLLGALDHDPRREGPLAITDLEVI